MFKEHERVHRNLIPGGEWWDTGEPPVQRISAAGQEEHEDQDEVDEEEEAEQVETKLVLKGDKYEVPWAKGEITEEVSGSFVVPWSGVKRAQGIDELVTFYVNLAGPYNANEWRAVEDYMDLFDHCEAMLRQELIDLPTFKEMYLDRLINVMSNRRIVIAKLGCKRKHWQGFIRLLDRVGIEVPPKRNLTIQELCDRGDKGSMATFGE